MSEYKKLQTRIEELEKENDLLKSTARYFYLEHKAMLKMFPSTEVPPIYKEFVEKLTRAFIQ